MATGYNGIQTYFPIPQQAYNECLAIVQGAYASWQGMVQQFAAENIAMGITQAGKTQLISDALYQVMVYGSSGSLWQAYAELSNVVITPEMAPFLTEARIDYMRNVMIQIISELP
jgi:flagellar basal body rod protein FlgG